MKRLVEAIGEKKSGIPKLLVIYAAGEIARLAVLDGYPKVVVTYSCPGPCELELARDWETLPRKISLAVIYATIIKTTGEGPRTLVYTRGQREDHHGFG